MKTSTARKLKAYSISLGSIVAAIPASAEIIYTDLDPDSTLQVSMTYNYIDTLLLDIDSNGIDDFGFNMRATSSWTWISNQRYTAKCAPLGSNYLVQSGSYPAALSPGSIIGSAANWGTDSTLARHLRSEDCCSNFTSFSYSTHSWGNFINQQDQYIGLKFDIDGAMHYGWIQVDVILAGFSFYYIDSENRMSIKSFAYNTVADEPIEAGEPVGIADQKINNVSIYGFNRQIHLVGKKGVAHVYNLEGKLVYHTPLANKTSIALDKGIYLVRVMDGGRSTTKKVYLD